MGELTVQYAPPILAWTLLLSRGRGQDSARRYVRWVLLGLAVSLTALSPAVYSTIGGLSGIQHLARLIGHGGMLFAVWAGQEFMVRMTGLGRGSRWQAWWAGGAFALLCLLFALAPSLLPQAPGVLEYCLVYLVGQLPALGTGIRLGWRYSRQADSLALRAGMRMIVAGAGCAMLYLVNKVVLTAASRFDFGYPAGHTFLVGKALPACAHVLVLAGAILPALLGWLRRYLLYQRLGALWWALYRAEPAIALDPPTIPDLLRLKDLRLHLYRRVIEIRDGLLALQPYREPHIAATIRERASQAGLRGRQLDAAVEAAALTAALRSRATGAPTTAPEPTITGGDDLDSDTAFLGQVAQAYRKAPCPGIGGRSG